jgi:hypothetical protein
LKLSSITQLTPTPAAIEVLMDTFAAGVALRSDSSCCSHHHQKE